MSLFSLTQLKEVAPTTKCYIFTPKDPATKLQPIPVASCAILKLNDVSRPYTPVTLIDDRHIEFCIKYYPNGQLTPHLNALKVGDDIHINLPIVKFEYQPNTWKHIGLLAGGTGITPMYQLMHRIFSNKDDQTRVTLIAAFRSEDEMLLKSEVDEFAKSPNFQIHYILSQPKNPDYKGLKGRIDRALIERLIPKPDRMFVCGPPGMMQSLSGDKMPDKSQGPLTGVLKDMGFSSDQVYKY